jgi:hypothetical protein
MRDKYYKECFTINALVRMYVEVMAYLTGEIEGVIEESMENRFIEFMYKKNPTVRIVMKPCLRWYNDTLWLPENLMKTTSNVFRWFNKIFYESYHPMLLFNVPRKKYFTHEEWNDLVRLNQAKMIPPLTSTRWVDSCIICQHIMKRWVICYPQIQPIKDMLNIFDVIELFRTNNLQRLPPEAGEKPPQRFLQGFPSPPPPPC